MRVLVIGSGAREHALVARLASERDVGELVAAPGNPGMARLARTLPVAIGDPEAVRSLAEREQIDFTIVGPELPLSVGIADRFADDARRPLGSSRARRSRKRSWRATASPRRGSASANRSTPRSTRSRATRWGCRRC